MPEAERFFISQKLVLAITVVVDIAINGEFCPVSSHALTSRHKLSRRALEPLLIHLVHLGILSSVRGPRGGYSLAKDPTKTVVGEIVRAASLLHTPNNDDYIFNSDLLRDVVDPVICEASTVFINNLETVTIHELSKIAAEKGFSGANY